MYPKNHPISPAPQNKQHHPHPAYTHMLLLFSAEPEALSKDPPGKASTFTYLRQGFLGSTGCVPIVRRVKPNVGH